MIRVVLYLRMSDPKQDTSVADQRAACREYAKKHGLRIVGEYVDEGISGDETEKRLAFQRMLRDATSGKFQGILCWDQDRFGRFDALECGYWIKPLRDAGIFLETINQGRIDWNDFAGRLIYTVAQESKHAYLRDLSKNVNRGMLSAAKSGKTLAGLPRGYVNKSGCVVIVEEDAEIVREIFRLYLSGMSCREVAETLNARGVRPLRAALWTRTTIYQALRNPFYVGEFVWSRRSQAKYSEIHNGAVVAVAPGQSRFRHKPADAVRIERHHEPIIDRDVFDMVQGMLAANRKTTFPRRSKNAFALSGLLICGACGAPMHGRLSGRKRLRYYVCSASLHSNACRSHAVSEVSVCQAVIDGVREQFGSELKSKELRDEVRRQLGTQEGSDLERRLSAIRQKLERVKRRLVECASDLLPIVQTEVRKLMGEEEALARAIRERDAARSAVLNLDDRIKAICAQTQRMSDAAAEPAKFRRWIARIVSSAKVHADTDPEHSSRFVLSRVEIAFSVGAVLNVWASLYEQE